MDALIQNFVQNPTAFIVSFICAFVLLAGFISLTVKLILVVIKKIKEGKIAEIPDLLLNYMAEAEKLIGASGETKKAVVMAKVQTYCAENKIKYDEATVSDLIEKRIDYSKEVNAKLDTESASTPIENKEFQSITTI